jgi:shikimate kinase
VSGRSDAEAPVKRIVLVGFMGSGKSTVGTRLARRMGWRFVDVDARIEEEAGRTIADIFRTQGEETFRRLEEAATGELLADVRVVIATGGGWAAREGRLEHLPPGTLSVWLQVSAETAVRRAERRPGTRPLLDVEEPLERARELLAQRDAHYARADLHLRSDGASADDMVRAILSALPADSRPDTVRRSRMPTPPRPLN